MIFNNEFRLDNPETIGETDKMFDLTNYCEWLEQQLIDARKQLSIHVVSQRSELFAEQDSKDFILWQRDREIRRLENGKYKWREFEYNREFFLEKYLEDRNKANCG